MESGGADGQSVGGRSSRELVIGNLLSKFENAVFREKTQSKRVRKLREFGGNSLFLAGS
jgi:hypothetical protein